MCKTNNGPFCGLKRRLFVLKWVQSPQIWKGFKFYLMRG